MNDLPGLDAVARSEISKLLAAGVILPVMNNAKWARLIKAMINTPQMNPEFRLHSVLASDDYSTAWDGEWHYHVHPVAEIEWIELRAISQDWLLSTLRTHSLPFSVDDGVPRVWGYIRPGVQPHWE